MSSTAEVAPRIDYGAILNPQFERKLYNPTDEPIEFEIAAKTHIIPAHDQMAAKAAWGVREDQEYPSFAKPGVLPLRAFMGHRTHGKNGFIPKMLDAAEIALFAVGAEGREGPMARRGIRLLSGDPATDELIVAEARIAAKEATYVADLDLVRRHEQINSKRKEEGMPMSPPSKRVQLAMARKLAYESSTVVASRYGCPVCAWPFLERAERDSHISIHHPAVAAQYGVVPNQAWDLQGNPIPTDVVTDAASGGLHFVTDEASGEVRVETPEEATVRLAKPQGGQRAREIASGPQIADLVTEMRLMREELDKAKLAAYKPVQAGGRGRKRQAEKKKREQAPPAPPAAPPQEG